MRAQVLSRCRRGLFHTVFIVAWFHRLCTPHARRTIHPGPHFGFSALTDKTRVTHSIHVVFRKQTGTMGTRDGYRGPQVQVIAQRVTGDLRIGRREQLQRFGGLRWRGLRDRLQHRGHHLFDGGHAWCLRGPERFKLRRQIHHARGLVTIVPPHTLRSESWDGEGVTEAHGQTRGQEGTGSARARQMNAAVSFRKQRSHVV